MASVKCFAPCCPYNLAAPVKHKAMRFLFILFLTKSYNTVMVLLVLQLYFLPLDHHLQVGHSNHAPPGGKYNFFKN